MNPSIPSGPVLITGATGFIGRRLTLALLAAGCEVTALVLPGEAHDLAEGVHPYTGDVTDPAAVVEALAACARSVAEPAPITIFHLAAIGMADPGLSMYAACQVNVGGVIHILEAVRAAENARSASWPHTSPLVRRVVMVGSSYEYGARRSDDELDPFNPYSASKAAAWAFARAAYNAWGTPVVWARPFQVYGPGQLSRALVPAAILAALRGEDFRMTKGEQQRDFVFVDDVVDGLVAAGGAPDIEGRVLDLGTGQLRRLCDVVARIWELAGGQGRILPGALPYRPGEVPAIPANVRRTRLLTGWESKTSLDEGLRTTIALLRCQAKGEQQPAGSAAPAEIGPQPVAVNNRLEDDHVA
ncbi:MAG: NAD-dependent epimerase/dehydratase family protein [Anaerolineae bacterium]|nr:NAD-dependent epimerase/dehydratase family protein [Anaerolineae bacterium]